MQNDTSQKQQQSAFVPDDFDELFSFERKPVLVGGQAVNVYAEMYSDISEDISRLSPFVSKDADVLMHEKSNFSA